MKLMKLLFIKANIFWVILRLLLILLFLGSLIIDSDFIDIQISSTRSFVYYFAFELNILCMTILSALHFLNKKANSLLQIYVAFYSIYYSVLTAQSLYEDFGKSRIYILALPLILFIFGIWQMYFDKKSNFKLTESSFNN